MGQKMLLKRTFALVFISAVHVFAVGCANLNDPYGYNSGYNAPPPPPASYYGGTPYYGGNPYYGGGYYGGAPIRREQRELERERQRLEDERRRLERERQNQQNVPQQYTRPSPPPPADRCPAGFSPSERKCTQEERRRGCRDMRMPSGLGCVSRR
jgi:hypothetical protein